MGNKWPSAREMLAIVETDEFAAEHGAETQEALARSLRERIARGKESSVKKKLTLSPAELLMMPSNYAGSFYGDGNSYPHNNGFPDEPKTGTTPAG